MRRVSKSANSTASPEEVQETIGGDGNKIKTEMSDRSTAP
jgi:hypothetical protein